MSTVATNPGTSGVEARTAALVSGVALLVMAVIAGVANFTVVQGVIFAGDPAATAANIVSRGGTMRLGALAFAVAAILDVLVAWGLYEVFRRVNSSVSLLGAWLRVAYAAIFAVATAHLFGAARLAGSDPNAAYLLANSFNDTWTLGLMVFGLHLLVVGALAIRAQFIHWIFGALLVIAGVGYVFDSVVALLGVELGFELALFTFVGEVVFIFWLLIRGRRVS